MFKKIVNYTKKELDYPIEADMRFLRKEGINYYLDFRKLNKLYLTPNASFDAKKVPRFNYAIVPSPNNSNGFTYSITYICWYALGCLQDYLETNDSGLRDSFLRQADWLLNNKTIHNGIVSWEIRFPWNIYGVRLPIPRVSSMDQGLAISVLIRAYLLTNEQKYLEIAKKAEPFYDISINEGGFKVFLHDGSIFYEMYPAGHLSMILDGHIFSMMGLYDLYSVSAEEKTRHRFECAMKTIVNNIEYWNYRNIWSWFGCFYLSSPMYHKINLCWLRVLSELSGEKKIRILADKWTGTYADNISKLYLKFRIFISSRRFLAGNALLGIQGRRPL